MTASTSPYPLVPISNSQLREIKSSIIGQEYQVKIRLPEDYAHTTNIYPVLYLLDGDHAFAMATDIVQYLIYGDHIPELIIVSPAYDSKKGPDEGGKNMRDRDFDMTPEGDRYLEFLEKELIPFAESNYRVSSTDRTLWGYSSSGYFALYALFQKPDLFQKYIIVDGCDNEEHSKVEKIYADKHSDIPIRLFISAPPERDASKFFGNLRGRNYVSLHAEYAQLNDIGHFAVSAEGLTKGLVSVFGK
jgi:predicted alpha/beta superfamily hydrolase